MSRLSVVASLLLLCVSSTAHADKRLAGIACRSVHLSYAAPEGTAFYNELTVDRSAEGTYFMACGFRMGYFGMQELASGKKVVLFSVWEPGKQNNPRATAKERRVKVLGRGKRVRVRRFGGEGTGGQSFFDYDWKTGETCRFLVRARKDGERTAFAGYFWVAKEKRWQHLATFSTLAGGKRLRGYYSFVEDFRRNRVSATKVRKARFGNGWVLTTKGKWQRLTKATFTADSNPVTNIDAGADALRFFLATGGTTVNSGAKLRGRIELKTSATKPPGDLPTGD
jgi:Domain of unknown function (DUF3472)